MSIMKRLSATLFSRIDRAVGEIENHDAVIQATLNEMRKKVAEAKVRLNQLIREQKTLRAQIQEQDEQSQQWRRRAVEGAKSDESVALECVNRARQCDQRKARLASSLEALDGMTDKLAGDIETSEQRLSAMKQKLTVMRARESTSSALSSTSVENIDNKEMLDETFDRWEINISQSEMAIDTSDPIDAMEREFVTKEQQLELRPELKALLEKEGER